MGVMKSLFSGKQMSEAFICSAFLALSGGFQDAYTYNTRNEVFSNAQTGNVVLMSQNFMTQTNRLWCEIFQIVKDNCTGEYSGANPQDDVMERLLTARKGK